MDLNVRLLLARLDVAERIAARTADSAASSEPVTTDQFDKLVLGAIAALVTTQTVSAWAALDRAGLIALEGGDAPEDVPEVVPLAVREWAARTSFVQLLGPAGWRVTRGHVDSGSTSWVAPGVDPVRARTGRSAVSYEAAGTFTAHAPLTAFPTGRELSKLEVLAYLNFDGDVAAATRSLVESADADERARFDAEAEAGDAELAAEAEQTFASQGGAL